MTRDYTSRGFGVLGFWGFGAVVNFAVAFIVTKVTGDASKEIQQLVENFRTPKGGVSKAADH